MKIIYICEICGNSSESKGTIETCESQEVQHQYREGQTVKFMFAPRGARQWVGAKVGEIKFEKGSHRPIYALVLTEDLIIDGKSISGKGVKHFGISEDNIRSA